MTPPLKSRAGPFGYLGALALVAAAGGMAVLADRPGQGANLAMIFLLGVLLSGLAFGLGPALAGAGAAILTYNLFFLEPRLSLAIRHPADVFTYAVFFAVAAATGWLAGRARDQASLAARRAETVGALLQASQRLSAAATPDGAAQVLAEAVCDAARAPALVFLPGRRGLVQAAGAPALAVLSPAALAAARQAWAQGVPTGAGTGEVADAGWSFWPLEGLQGRSGVAAAAVSRHKAAEEGMVAAILRQGAVAIERAQLAAGAAEAEALRRSDRLRSALLNSISHDLRTPLSTILGSTTTLIAYGPSLEPPVRADLLESVREEAERLNRYVGELLDITRVEGGALVPRHEMIDVREVMDSATERVVRRLGSRRLSRDAPESLSMVEADAGLLEQALVNVLENAIAYTPDASAIEVAAFEDRGHVVLSVEDDGPGIPPEALEHVFEKFHRMDQPSDRHGGAVQGAGLGLAIAKGFVEAMGGRIAAASPVHEGRGARFLISLPKAIATHEHLL
ncbi:MAG TPA: ATP-binding protein [Caulobacteraceae bacterium]|jgi:two-component system sensor histidine kinase KdpD|nr:ATP-binding protein [Caulobacteraceae bacterium]